MGFMAPLAIAGLALTAAGAGVNMMNEKAKSKDIAQIHKVARKQVEANQEQANKRFEEGLQTMTPEDQARLMKEGEASRMKAFEENTQDVADVTNVMGQSEDAPAIVKTEAARQLGDELAKMRADMQARSRLGAWDDRGLASNLTLSRTGQDIGQLGAFSQGTAQAAEQGAQLRAADKSMLGDLLQAGGSLAIGASGGLNGIVGGATGAAGAAGVPAAAGAAAQPYALMPADASWYQRLITPINAKRYVDYGEQFGPPKF